MSSNERALADFIDAIISPFRTQVDQRLKRLDEQVPFVIADVHDKQTSEVIRVNKEVGTAQWNAAAAYSQLVVAVGYAAFFGALFATRSELPWRFGPIAMFLGLVSAGAFVFFEVFRQWTLSVAILSLDKQIRNRGFGPDDVVRAQDAVTASIKKKWLPAFCLSVAGGLLAWIILGIGVFLAMFQSSSPALVATSGAVARSNWSTTASLTGNALGVASVIFMYLGSTFWPAAHQPIGTDAPMTVAYRNRMRRRSITGFVLLGGSFIGQSVALFV